MVEIPDIIQAIRNFFTQANTVVNMKTQESPSLSLIVLTCQPAKVVHEAYRAFNVAAFQRTVPGFETFLVQFLHVPHCEELHPQHHSPLRNQDHSYLHAHHQVTLNKSPNKGHFNLLKEDVIPFIREKKPFNSTLYVWLKAPLQTDVSTVIPSVLNSVQSFQFHIDPNNTISTDHYEIFGGSKLVLLQKLYGLKPLLET